MAGLTQPGLRPSPEILLSPTVEPRESVAIKSRNRGQNGGTDEMMRTNHTVKEVLVSHIRMISREVPLMLAPLGF